MNSRIENYVMESSSSYSSETDMANGVTRMSPKKLRLDAFDKLSVRIGSTLRRYPLARVFILLYMVSISSFYYVRSKFILCDIGFIKHLFSTVYTPGINSTVKLKDIKLMEQY